MIVRTHSELPARFRRLRFVLASVTAVLAVLAVVCSLLAVRYQERIVEASRYNGAFDFSQTSVELLRLQLALTGADSSLAQLRFDILRNRLDVVSANDLLDDAERGVLIRNLDLAIDEIGPLIARLPSEDAARAASLRLRPFISPILQLASRAHSEAGDRILANQHDLQLVFAGVCAVTMTLVAFGAILVGLVVNQNRKLDRVVRTDALTGLANRLAFNAALASVRDQQTAVVLIDVDHFKILNDTLGHAAGDRFLVILADRLREAADDAAAIARIGGDEFALLYSGTNADLRSLRAAERIIAAMERRFVVDDRELTAGVTIGASCATTASDAASLFNDADIALYTAKLAGRGRYLAFEPAMKRDILHRQRLTDDLHHAIGNGELFLLYQPIVEVATGRTLGFEALVRWQHPELGVVSPVEFIPIAETSGQIAAIGAWVLAAAGHQAASWPDEVFVAVNVSARQLDDPSLIHDVRRVIDENRLKHGRLTIEITESTLIDNDATALAVLHELQALGCRIALDDFGTGYASLSYLQRFPFDKLKVDRSFLKRVDDGEGAAIVLTICALASQLLLTVVAEGIETEAQLAFARSAGIRFGQGYLFDRPLSADAADERLALELSAASVRRVA